MNWSEAAAKIVYNYGVLADWVFLHPVEADAIVVFVVVGSIYLLLKKRRMARSRAYRIIWGELMKRKDREAMQRMRFEDAIVDAAMEMVHHGDMTEQQEKEWYEFFMNTYNMKGFSALKDLNSVKRGIKKRLQIRFGLIPKEIPGGKPGVVSDPSYKPVIEDVPARKGLETSKYV